VDIYKGKTEELQKVDERQYLQANAEIGFYMSRRQNILPKASLIKADIY